jgi:hypothetical protein
LAILGILTVRNEGAFLLEWLAHHRAAGFDRFLVFSNDCQDGTDAMLDRLQVMGWLTHVRNDAPHRQGPQWDALKAADRHPLVAAADWIMVLDVDEFVNVQTGDGTLAALLAAVPQATAFAMTWRMFGNAGIARFEDRPVRDQFTRTAPRVLHWPWRALQIKTLFRNDGTFGKLGIHRPRRPDPLRLPQADWVDGAGHAIAPEGRSFLSLGSDPYGLVQINHYALQSAESYLVKADRGRANREASAFDLGYWVERNFADVEDRSILRLAPQVVPILADLHADAGLGRLHRAAVDWRRARFAALMEEEPWRALYGRLLMAPPTRVLTAGEARSIWDPAARA